MRLEARRIEALAIDVTDLCSAEPELCKTLRRLVPRDIGTVYYVVDEGREYIVAVGGDAVKIVTRLLEEKGHTIAVAGAADDERIRAGRDVLVSLVDNPRRDSGRGLEDIEVEPGGDPIFCVTVRRGGSRWRCCTRLSVIEAVIDVLAGGELGIHELAGSVAARLGLSQFFENGAFDWKRFYGDRNAYHQYFYCPLRVLERIGAVTGGRKKRLAMSVDEARAVLEKMVERVRG